MSSDDSGFDKEAEREKLREKYEEDRKDREATQRMSELLLQGATMTGKHCGECGDPIFRYDGQEFCPTCQREVEGGSADAGAADGPEQAGGRSESPDETATDAADARTDEPEPRTQTDESDGATADESADAGDGDGEPRVEINDVRVADRHADRSNIRRPPSQQGDSRGREGAADRPHRHGSRTRDAGGRAPERASDAPDESPETARASLVRTLNELARRAEEADDVARTRDLLAATREAAEALAALNGTKK